MTSQFAQCCSESRVVAGGLTLGFGRAVFGAGNLPTALLVGAAWAINLAVAERQIRKRPRRGTPAAPVQVPLP